MHNLERLLETLEPDDCESHTATDLPLDCCAIRRSRLDDKSAEPEKLLVTRLSDKEGVSEIYEVTAALRINEQTALVPR